LHSFYKLNLLRKKDLILRLSRLIRVWVTSPHLSFYSIILWLDLLTFCLIVCLKRRTVSKSKLNWNQEMRWLVLLHLRMVWGPISAKWKSSSNHKSKSLTGPPLLAIANRTFTVGFKLATITSYPPPRFLTMLIKAFWKKRRTPRQQSITVLFHTLIFFLVEKLLMLSKP
jgi:hypothetical protein